MSAEQPTRLESLRGLHARIGMEIEREMRYLERIERLSGAAKAIVTSRNDYDARLIAVTAAHFAIGPDDITSDRRTRKISNARMVACWLLRNSGRTFPEIGRALSKDHSTAINACHRVEADDELMEHAAVIRAALVGTEGAA